MIGSRKSSRIQPIKVIVTFNSIVVSFGKILTQNRQAFFS